MSGGGAGRPKFVVHAGMHKTGSSAVQAFCRKHPRVLKRLGIAYPRAFYQNHKFGTISLFMDEPAKPREDVSHRPRGYAPDDLKHAFDAFLERAAKKRQHVLLSSETAVNLSPDGLRRLDEAAAPSFAPVEIVALLRPPLSFAQSASQQRLKGGMSLGRLEERLPLPEYERRFEHMLAHFGPERLHLAPYHPSTLVGGDVFQTVVSLMGLDPAPAAAHRTERRNTAMSLTAAKALSVFNACIRENAITADVPASLAARFDDPVMHRFHDGFSISFQRHDTPMRLLLPVFTGISGPPYRLTGTMMDNVTAASRSDCEWLSRNFDIDIQAFDIAPDEAVPAESLTTFEPDELARIEAALDAFIANAENTLLELEEQTATPLSRARKLFRAVTGIG
ncbi:hypothetical protein RDV64_20740 [Acuticoccus sp. MNP-M23]|uniref:hypothetical protein n=1 Tax=Acuticoccus sp. MNP-M23 TaxID=3072793 RepID=UPI002814B22C|nr:hypothetical protein [Acuticoccus sp. MNP-M23]WMS42462.1 hypothetical protein RDV64_20740 [Acuticoccus sp. MNP-M23]